jgi:hypothetical protein
MQQADLKQVLRSIVADLAPDELTTFDIEGDALLDESVRGISSPEFRSELDSKFGLGEAAAIAGSATVFLKLISATVSALKDVGLLVKKSKPATVSTDDIKAKWVGRLRQAGLPSDKAEKIARRFTKELLQAAAKG